MAFARGSHGPLALAGEVRVAPGCKKPRRGRAHQKSKSARPVKEKTNKKLASGIGRRKGGGAPYRRKKTRGKTSCPWSGISSRCVSACWGSPWGRPAHPLGNTWDPNLLDEKELNCWKIDSKKKREEGTNTENLSPQKGKGRTSRRRKVRNVWGP